MKLTDFWFIMRSAFIAGLCIGIAGFGYLAEKNIIGATLFSFGLLAVVGYGLKLYTGTAGFFKKGDVKVALYGSRDLHSWFMVYSSTDHYLRGFRGTPYKFYRIAVSASLDLPDTISGCTTQFELRQMNQPR